MQSDLMIFSDDMGIFTIILAIISILGGVFLLADLSLGGLVAIICGGINGSIFLVGFLFSGFSPDPLGEILAVGILLSVISAISGFFGSNTDKDHFRRRGKGLKNFLVTNIEGLAQEFNVKKISFWRNFLEGFAVLVIFKEDVSESDVINLILFLQTKFFEKIYVISKKGPGQAESSENTYRIYKLEMDHLQIEEKSVDIK